jgi:torulene dioxygenase
MLEKLIPSQKSYKFFQNLHTSTPDNAVEIREPISLQKVSGEVPDWLNGIMYRIGKLLYKGKLHTTNAKCAAISI